ncbi:MAG: caspase family protein [Drouetiella hepatica Uher 2000/2452]|jgi:WD40 repeat protein|uniref:Caspase family protein n=1 Tax=Drouetiella hepatica Uher 2000/2452 TaxID=904376 RepID=A0A951QD14_9CYAN|nr:caspase family protein [Drouetiella hepatica Uher 2000/2452]
MSRDALVVGINTYKFMSGLQAPASDAEAIAQQLHTYGEFRVHRLPEVIQAGKPQVGQKTTITLRELESSLINLFKPKGNTIPHTALFYFSGHGIQREAGIQEGYLALSDSNPDKGSYGLSLFWLRRLLQESPVRQRIVILDCCHSGEFLHFLEADPGARPGTDRLFMAASREYETAYESLESPYSIFTQAILTGLDPSRVESGTVTSHSLTDWVSHKLKSEIQQPLFESSGSEIILTRGVGGQSIIPKVHKSSPICPYRGLECFDETHSEYFFGREELTAELVNKLQSDRFVAIVGASGIGKSSLVRAGLVATLKQRAPLQWQIKFLTPGEHPLKSLANAFIDSNLGNLERAEQLRRAETFLQDGGRGLAQLVQASLPMSSAVSGAIRPRMLLIIDQFEEAFTLSRGSRAEQERQQFFNCLMGALEATDSDLSVAIALRSDFQSKCALYEGLAHKIEQHRVVVNPLKYEQIKATILKPAQKIGLVCEPSLVYNMMLDIIGAPGELPLLQYTLLELWNHRRTGLEGGVARLTLDTYQELGGMRGTLQKRATEVFSQLTLEEQTVAKRIFLALTQLGEGTEDTRRRVMKSELVSSVFPAALVEQVLEKMVAAKLVVTSCERGWQAPKKQDQIGSTAIGSSIVLDKQLTGEMVDVVHETLIRNWGLLRNWLDENREMLRRMRRIEQAAQEWGSAGQPSGEFLMNGLRLRDAEDFQRTYPQELSALAQRYIAASHSETRRARRESRQLQIAVPTVLLIALAAVLNQYRGTLHWQAEKDHQIQLATSRERAAIAQTILQDGSSDPMTALLVSRLAAESGGANYETQSSLRAALQDLRLQLELKGHEGAVHQLAFSPDRRHLATAGADGRLRLWAIDAQTILNSPLKPIKTLSWSELRNSEVSSSQTESSEISKPDSNKTNNSKTESDNTKGDKTGIRAIAFSPDGRQVAAIAHNSPLVKVWSVETGTVLLQLTNLAPVNQVMFSPDGKWVATQSDRSISLWRADTGQLQARLPQSSDIVSLQFSPDGKMFLAALQGDVAQAESGSAPSATRSASTVQLWRLTADPAQQLKLQALSPLVLPSPITCAKFSPSSSIATASTDGKVRLWSATGQLRQTFTPAHPSTLSPQPPAQLQFSPDESLLAIASPQQTWLWNLQTGQMQAELILTPHSAKANSLGNSLLQFSPDGQLIITKGSAVPSSEQVYLWNTQTGQQVSTMQSNGVLESAEFSPDGTYIALNANGIVQLWATEAGGELPTIYPPNAMAEWSMFLPASTEKAAQPATEQGLNRPEHGPIATRLMTVTPDGKLQNWQILADAPSPSPTPPSVSPSYSAIMEPQRIWQYLSALMGQRSPSGLSMLSSAAPKSAETESAEPTKAEAQNPSAIQHEGAIAALNAYTALPGSVLSPSLNSRSLNSRLSGVAFSPEGQHIVTATAEGQMDVQSMQPDRSTAPILKIRNWRLIPGQNAALSEVVKPSSSQLSSPGGEPLSISQLSFSPDGRQILGVGDDLTVRLWDAQTGQLLRVFKGHKATIQRASFSPDGREIVTASWDRTVQIWQIASGEAIQILSHADAVNGASFSPDGQHIATASWDGRARVWSRKTGKLKFLLTGHGAEVFDAEFSPDGRSLVTASADGTAIVWDARTGHKQSHLRPGFEDKPPIPLLQANFSPDGQYIATRTKDGKVHLWAGTWEMLLKLARDRSLRQLTPEECNRYLRAESGACPTLPL